MEALSGKDWNGQKLYAARAQKRAERHLKSQFEKRKIERINRYKGINLYVKNLDDTIDDARLREKFSAYGTITSAKVMVDDENNSKGTCMVGLSFCKSRLRCALEAYIGVPRVFNFCFLGNWKNLKIDINLSACTQYFTVRKLKACCNFS